MKTTLAIAKGIALGAVMIAVAVLAGCGGTFALRPDGSLSYTTPEILKAPIVREK